MDTLTLAEARNKRSHIKASVTRLKTFIESFDVQQGSRHDVTERKTKLTELWNHFDIVQSRIEILEHADPSITDKESLINQQVLQRANFETPYFNLMSRYNSVLEHYDRQADQSLPTLQNDTYNLAVNTQSRVKLPKMELPIFAGSYDWYSFQDTFEKLIHTNESLSDIERFHYLRSSLKDKAAEVIKSIETTTDNYNEAWAAVKERFDNKRWIIQKHIRAIFEAPTLTKESHIKLRELLDIVLKHLRALKAMKRPTEAWDDLIIHIIVSKLDSATNKAWEISIPNKEIPNLKSLIEFLSKRSQALETIFSKLSVNQFNAQPKSIAKAKNSSVANLATSNLSCPQCKGNHPLYYCEAFLKLPIEKRIQLVKKAHLCINCLRSTSHQSKNCNSSSCRKCTKKHNTLLHLVDSIDNSEKGVSNDAVISETEKAEKTHSIVTQCLSTQRSLNVMLSTAVVHVYDHKNQIHSARVLLDSGSQINFIAQDFANKLSLKERSIDISISGIAHGAMQAKRMIPLRIKSRFNNFTENIECVVLPKIT